MKRLLTYLGEHKRGVGLGVLAGVVIAGLMLFRLGSLTGGLSSSELAASTAPVGWHGIYHQPYYLPLKIVRSAVFVLFRDHGQTLTRLPNALFGALATIAFVWLIRLWHSPRIALLTGLLFATGAWTLHASRLASFDVLYLWATPMLLLMNSLLQRSYKHWLVWYGSLTVGGLLLYVPGLVWFVMLGAYLRRDALIGGWRFFSSAAQRSYYGLLAVLWLPLLVVNFTRSGALSAWLGLPAHWPTIGTLIKHIAAVPVHLFIRGPQYPDIWLGKAPILDIFTLAMCLIGIYFYARHLGAGRSRLLGSWALLGWLLVGLGGPVGLSLLVPLLYIGAAAGIAYLLHQWMRTFPNNPLARSVGLTLIAVAVGLSCLYNLRAYFVAWPHNPPTTTVFRYRR